MSIRTLFTLKGERETELAFQIADRYISIQETDSGYDYSIMGMDYKEIDGGVYDNPNLSIREALHEIMADLKDNPFDNGARGNSRDDDELIPIDYDGLMERVEAAGKIEPEGNVVADFKAKTDELFHGISEMNPAEIEETVKCHVQANLDVVVELSTNEREDVLFDTFNEGGLQIGGIKVDINPITAQRTGTLETYLPKVEEYLDGVREARENEPISLFNIRMNDEERWFKNTSGLDAEGLCKAYAECKLPFVDMGQYGERIDIGEFASIEQGERLDFSIEFNAETDRFVFRDSVALEDFQKNPDIALAGIGTMLQQRVRSFLKVCAQHDAGELSDEEYALWKSKFPAFMEDLKTEACSEDGDGEIAPVPAVEPKSPERSRKRKINNGK